MSLEGYNLTNDDRTANIIAKQREKLNELARASTRTHTQTDEIKELIFNKDKLISYVKKIIDSNDDTNINKCYDKCEEYSSSISEEINKLLIVKQNLDLCMDFINKSTESNLFFVQIEVDNPGKFIDVEYEDINQIDRKAHLLRIDVSKINRKLIHISDNTKRTISLQMQYVGGLVVNYNIKFDLSTMDKLTKIINGSFYLTR